MGLTAYDRPPTDAQSRVKSKLDGTRHGPAAAIDDNFGHSDSSSTASGVWPHWKFGSIQSMRRYVVENFLAAFYQKFKDTFLYFKCHKTFARQYADA